jgi:hypothetical protein
MSSKPEGKSLLILFSFADEVVSDADCMVYAQINSYPANLGAFAVPMRVTLMVPVIVVLDG